MSGINIVLKPKAVVATESVIIPKSRPKKNELNSEKNIERTIINPRENIGVAFKDPKILKLLY